MKAISLFSCLPGMSWRREVQGHRVGEVFTLKSGHTMTLLDDGSYEFSGSLEELRKLIRDNERPTWTEYGGWTK